MSVYGHSSGAGLVLHAATQGLSIAKIVLHDPPTPPMATRRRDGSNSDLARMIRTDPSATRIASPRSSHSFRTEVNALVDAPALAPAVFSADVLLQRTGELPKGLFDRRQFWWGRRPGTQPSAVNRQLE